MFKRKFSVSILDENWTTIQSIVNLSILPRINEYIYLNNKYYIVLNIVHYVNDKHGVFLIVNEIKKDLVKNLTN